MGAKYWYFGLWCSVCQDQPEFGKKVREKREIQIMKSCALLGAAVFITSSASATVTGLSVESTYHAASNRDIYSVYVLSNGPTGGLHDVMLNMIGHQVTTGTMANVVHTDAITAGYGDGYGHWNASYTSGTTASTSNQYKDTYVTITGKVGLNASTSLDPSFGSGLVEPGGSTAIPAAGGWYTSNPAVDILITGGKIKVMQIAINRGTGAAFALQYTGTMSVGYKLQGTTSPLYAMNLPYTIGVPAPGALALLGFAGLCSRRRRA